MEKEKVENQEIEKVSWKAYLVLAFAIIFFSGVAVIIATKYPDIKGLSAIDFSVLNGKFGVMKTPATANFQGQGGTGAMAGFLLALSLFPTVMFALGFIEVVEHYGGLKAAQRILNPLLRPLLGLPGLAGLALISSLQSTDAGSGMTKALFDEGLINEKERTIFSAFQFTAGGAIPNYISVASALMAALVSVMPFFIPLVVILFFKVVGANMARFYVTYIVKEID